MFVTEVPSCVLWISEESLTIKVSRAIPHAILGNQVPIDPIEY